MNDPILEVFFCDLTARRLVLFLCPCAAGLKCDAFFLDKKVWCLKREYYIVHFLEFVSFLFSWNRWLESCCLLSYFQQLNRSKNSYQFYFTRASFIITWIQWEFSLDISVSLLSNWIDPKWVFMLLDMLLAPLLMTSRSMPMMLLLKTHSCLLMGTFSFVPFYSVSK